MNDTDRYRLLYGPYGPPRCRVGGMLRCAVRGRVRVVAISDAPIQWPLTRAGTRLSPVVCGGLLKAIRRESAQAVCHWWGVCDDRVWKWRKALGIPHVNEGTSRLLSAWAPETVGHRDPETFRRSLESPERRAKIAAARRGKKRPPEVVAKMRAANLGKKASAAARANMSAAQNRRGAWPPAAGRPWTAEEEKLLGTDLDRIVAERIGRDVTTLAAHRKKLGIPSYRERHGYAASTNRQEVTR